MPDEKPHKCPPAGVPAYTATLADMFSLLLTFFILLLSFANMDLIKFQAMSKSIQEAFGTATPTSEGIFKTSPTPIDFETKGHNSLKNIDLQGVAKDEIVIEETKEKSTNDRIAKDIAKVVAEAGMEDTVTVKSSSRGVLMQVQGQVFFSPGAAGIKDASHPFLDEIARIIKATDLHVAIEGHTDDTPINTDKFPSNWELSTSRAISTLRYLTETAGIPADRLSSAGFADTRPLVPNDTFEHKNQNRRVEFVIFKDDREEF
ncbi:MAG: flagellar motor protein MotB [Leptospirillia bacterium]